MSGGKVAPVWMWAVIVQTKHSRWLRYDTVRRTRREAIRAYVEMWNEEYQLNAWADARRKGYTCERVTVEVDNG